MAGIRNVKINDGTEIPILSYIPDQTLNGVNCDSCTTLAQIFNLIFANDCYKLGYGNVGTRAGTNLATLLGTSLIPEYYLLVKIVPVDANLLVCYAVADNDGENKSSYIKFIRKSSNGSYYVQTRWSNISGGRVVRVFESPSNGYIAVENADGIINNIYVHGLNTAAFTTVTNNLTTNTAGTSCLDANQGRVLNEKIETYKTQKKTRTRLVQVAKQISTDISYTGVSFTLTEPAIVRCSITYENVYNTELGISTSTSLINILSVSNPSGGFINFTQVLDPGTYYIWAKASSAGNNTIIVDAYYL